MTNSTATIMAALQVDDPYLSGDDEDTDPNWAIILLHNPDKAQPPYEVTDDEAVYLHVLARDERVVVTDLDDAPVPELQSPAP